MQTYGERNASEGGCDANLQGTERRGAGRALVPSSSSAGAGGGGRASSPRPAARPGVRSLEARAARTADPVPDPWAASAARRPRPTPPAAERAAPWARERVPTEPGAVSAERAAAAVVSPSPPS